MPTETETPAVEMLERAVANVARAKSEVEKQQRRRDCMQRAANKASELEEAAPLERKNAEAKYLVLSNRLKSAEEETKESGRAEATATMVENIGEWQRTAGSLYDKFKEYAQSLTTVGASRKNAAEKIESEAE